MREPKQKPGKSVQNYATPDEFMCAVMARFGPIAVDLAADAKNAQAEIYYTKERDSLVQPWGALRGNLWLNPPYGEIPLFALKCCATRRPHGSGLILMLTPASIGSNWFADHVHGTAYVLGLRPRLTFVGCDQPYPKDLMLSVYASGDPMPGFGVWRWK